MPTPKEIKNFSEQYAELTDSSPADKDYVRAIAQCFTEWLSKDYAIVPKCKLQGEYKRSYLAALENTTCLDRQYARGRYQVLGELFGKSLFEE